MAKLKKTENMSALDYLCKKLNWLVKKIEASSRGKISKRDLLIYGLIIIFILSVRLGGIIGALTFVLAVATIWNICVTRGLLRESKVASERARIAFESGLFREIVFSVMQLDTQRRMAPVGAEKRKADVQNFTVGILRSLKKSDMPTYTRIRENIQKLWPPTGGLGGTVGAYFREAVKKVEAEEKKEGEA